MPPALSSKTRKSLVIAGAVVGALLLLPFAIPLGGFIPEIEQAASERLKDPVRIQSLRVFLLPYPHLTVGGIDVGAKPYLQVRKVVVTPALLSLFSDQKVIREISLRGVVVQAPLLSRIAGWTGGASSSAPAPVRIERVAVREADLNLKGVRLQDVDLDLALDEKGALAQALFEASKGRLKARLLPKGKDFSIQLTARNWTLPVGPPLQVAALDAGGTIGKAGLSLPEISGKFYDGTLAGKLDVGWKDAWSLQGNLDIRQVDVKPLVAVFTKGTTLSGRLSAAPVINMRAPSAAELANVLRVDADFHVDNGVIHDFDLAAAPKALIKKDALKGGETRFDRFSGYLIVDATGYHLIDLQIASGVLKAEGELSISPKQELDGVMDVAIKGTSALVSTPLAIGGTVQSPLVYPSTAAIAGAAAGTALLGPGLGTSVGMKAMRLTGRLFSGKKRTPRPKPAQEPSAAPDPPTKATPKGPVPGSSPPSTPAPKASAPVEASGRR
jgi:uncharacterized protein involved in outer membrane biogenesis